MNRAAAWFSLLFALSFSAVLYVTVFGGRWPWPL
jgi:hypothetical protein